ncbi:unnamed protein product [Oncorhynchus mykiss]|uniref:WHIM2 domain-containing protein n=1 Tax=Oncorhynchus mykiss TaxID=8022 RepID=A0A060W601_ONCMY|nr:unnamed protein product [Oncorhynchus mykiss]
MQSKGNNHPKAQSDQPFSVTPVSSRELMGLKLNKGVKKKHLKINKSDPKNTDFTIVMNLKSALIKSAIPILEGFHVVTRSIVVVNSKINANVLELECSTVLWQPKDEPKEVSPEELAQQQQREKELQEKIQKAAACTYILPLGRDRLYRRYWLFPSTPALFVEDDYFGLTEDMLEPQEPTQEPAKAEGMETGCTPGPVSKPVLPALVQSSSAPSVNRPNRWAFYSSPQEVEMLIEALNPRGHRESSLKEALVQEKERIAQLLGTAAAADRYHRTAEAAGSKVVSARSKAAPALLEGTAAPAEKFMGNRLRDLLLDIEDRIYQGTLGQIKVMERSEWRKALEEGHYELLSPELKENGFGKGENGDVEKMDINFNVKKDGLQVSLFRIQELKGESMTAASSPSTPQLVNNTVHYLAQALAHIQQGIERKFLKAPLGRPAKLTELSVEKRYCPYCILFPLKCTTFDRSP